MCTEKNKNDLPWITILSTDVFFPLAEFTQAYSERKNIDNSHHKCVFNLPSNL